MTNNKTAKGAKKYKADGKAEHMKTLAQTFLICGGLLYLLGSSWIVYYAWRMHIGFGGDLTVNDKIFLWSPVIAAASVVAGLVWRKIESHGK
jgi:hypothetical protein